MEYSHDLKRYITLYQAKLEATDEAVRVAIDEELWKLWYHYLTPADKKIVEQK